MSDPNAPQDPQNQNPDQGRFAPPGESTAPGWDAPATPGYGQNPSNPATPGYGQNPSNPAAPGYGSPDPATGWGTPSTPPGYGQLPPYAGQPGSWTSPSYNHGPKPPVIPFHPLTIGELFQGTFAAIRSNPKVMFVFSVAVMGMVGLIAAIINGLLFPQFSSWIDWLNFDPGLDSNVLPPVPSAPLPVYLLQLLVSLLQAGAAMLITGMLVLAVTNAIVGANRDLKGTWEQLKPKFWRLVGTSILVGLIVGGVAVVGVFVIILLIATIAMASAANDPGVLLGLLVLILIPVLIGLVLWLTVRLYFATMCTVVEDVSPTKALQRSWQLTKGNFWRILGRLLLMGIVVAAASSILTGAIDMIFGGILTAANAPMMLTFVVISMFTALVTGLVQPVTAAYNSLMYVDERIRKEDLGPRLQAALDANQ